MSKRFGLLGEKLGHSFSPQIHALLADYEYRLIEIAPREVESFLRNGDFDGLNVTIPYKKTVLPLCAALSGEAARIGSVNTIIKRNDGSLYGDNTDYYGFSYMLGKSGAGVRGKKALVLGSGGAAATVRAVLGDAGAGEVVTISRGGPDNYENIGKNADARIIVNATPVGMYPENGASPVRMDIFRECESVLDVVYNPARTELMLQAQELGVPCVGGLSMLAAQAKRACELFTGGVIADEVIERIERIIGNEMINIALIGMPGCGKTSVGRRIAEITGREFFDIDELITNKAGKSIERVFADDGEAVFRDMESDILGDISKKQACVIATGGGIVKKPANRRLLRQNSITVFIDRKLSELPSDGRPLSLSQGVDKLYAERLPLYLQWSDYKISSGGGVEQTARAVLETIGI